MENINRRDKNAEAEETSTTNLWDNDTDFDKLIMEIDNSILNAGAGAGFGATKKPKVTQSSFNDVDAFLTAAYELEMKYEAMETASAATSLPFFNYGKLTRTPASAVKRRVATQTQKSSLNVDVDGSLTAAHQLEKKSDLINPICSVAKGADKETQEEAAAKNSIDLAASTTFLKDEDIADLSASLSSSSALKPDDVVVLNASSKMTDFDAHVDAMGATSCIMFESEEELESII